MQKAYKKPIIEINDYEISDVISASTTITSGTLSDTGSDVELPPDW